MHMNMHVQQVERHHACTTFILACVACVVFFCVMDCKLVQMEWLTHVNGITIYPKLPVYLRTHHTEWARNQRIKDAIVSASLGIERLKEVNAANTIVRNPLPSTEQPASMPSSMPSHSEVSDFHVEQHTMMPVPSANMPPPVAPRVVGGVLIGGAQQPPLEKRKHGQRGPDKAKRKVKACRTCKSHGDPRATDCGGRKWRKDCPHKNRCQFYS